MNEEEQCLEEHIDDEDIRTTLLCLLPKGHMGMHCWYRVVSWENREPPEPEKPFRIWDKEAILEAIDQASDIDLITELKIRGWEVLGE